MGDFGIDTRAEGGGGRYRAHISREWEIWGPNGGFVAAIALRAAGREAEIARPASFSGHFLGRAAFAPVDLDVTKVHGGRRSEALHVVMRQGAGGEGLKTYGELFPDGPWPPSRFWDNIEGGPIDPARALEPPEERRP